MPDNNTLHCSHCQIVFTRMADVVKIKKKNLLRCADFTGCNQREIENRRRAIGLDPATRAAVITFCARHK